MSLTFADICDLVIKYTKEPSSTTPVYATDATLLSLANLAQNKIALRTKCIVASNVPNSVSDPSTTTTDGTRLYSRPSDFLEAVKVQVDGQELKPISISGLFKKGGYNFWQQKGVPEFYYFESGKLGLWYTPSGSWAIGLWYVKRPIAMTGDASTPDVEENLHLAIVYWCCSEVMRMRREFALAKQWESSFIREVDEFMANSVDTHEGYGVLQDAAGPTD
jgi:hypothetical protein